MKYERLWVVVIAILTLAACDRRLWYTLLNRQGDAVAAGDAAGPFLHILNRISATAPANGILGLPVLRTSAVSASRTKASGTTNTYIWLETLDEL